MRRGITVDNKGSCEDARRPYSDSAVSDAAGHETVKTVLSRTLVGDLPKYKDTKYMKTIRILNIIVLAGIWLGGCSRDVDSGADPDKPVPVDFTAGIAATRTANGGDEWASGDAVGIYMLAAGGSLATQADILADNVRYDITDAPTGSLSPASGFPLYYPLTGSVDFIAYYPYRDPSAADPHTYEVSVADQTDMENINVMYASLAGQSKDRPAVSLVFRHAMSRITLAVKAGTGLASDDISALDASSVVFGGMPVTATLALRDGALTAGTVLTQTFNPRKYATSLSGFDASFTAILVPQAAGSYTGRTVVFTIGDQSYTWTIPADEVFAAGDHCTYPVTVNKTGITVGDPEITDWTFRDNGTDMAQQVLIVPESNSYMVEPDGIPIMIPVSQANRVLTADGLGAQTKINGETVLGGVTVDNYTVELVWSDLPIGETGVLKEIRAEKHDGKGYVCVKPGVAGNAVIAIRDKNINTIKWSWHIWVTEPVGQGTDAITGLTWMDRALGAESDTPLVNGVYDEAQWVKTFGPYYQWGRKDAFPGSDGGNSTRIYYTPSASGGTTDDPSSDILPELPGLVQHPLSLANSTNYNGSLSVTDTNNDSWGGISGGKTIYDPCPPGWKVPPIQVGAILSWGYYSAPSWTVFANRGRVYNGVGGTAALGHFYAASGYRSGYYGTISNVGVSGGYYSSDSRDNSSMSLFFQNGSILNTSIAHRSISCQMRCVAE